MGAYCIDWKASTRREGTERRNRDDITESKPAMYGERARWARKGGRGRERAESRECVVRVGGNLCTNEPAVTKEGYGLG
jgi:hypothetical protein